MILLSLLLLLSLRPYEQNFFSRLKELQGKGKAKPKGPLIERIRPLAKYRLEEYVPLYHLPKVPTFVMKLTADIEVLGQSYIGVYRKAGLALVYETMVEKYLTTHELDNEVYKVSDLTSALKLFFRSLSEPLLTYEYRSLFLESAQNHDKMRLKELVKALLLPNRDTLSYLILHLHRMAAKSAYTSMTLENLAISFGTTLYGEDETFGIADADNYRIINLELLSLDTDFYESMLRLTLEDQLFTHKSPVQPALVVKRNKLDPSSDIVQNFTSY